MQIAHHLSELWKKQKGSFFMKHRVVYICACFRELTRRSHLPMAQRNLRDQWPMHSYAQLLSKLVPLPHSLGRGQRKILKCDKLFH